jgi:hypothetical protein
LAVKLLPGDGDGSHACPPFDPMTDEHSPYRSRSEHCFESPRDRRRQQLVLNRKRPCHPWSHLPSTSPPIRCARQPSLLRLPCFRVIAVQWQESWLDCGKTRPAGRAFRDRSPAPHATGEAASVRAAQGRSGKLSLNLDQSFVRHRFALQRAKIIRPPKCLEGDDPTNKHRHMEG